MRRLALLLALSACAPRLTSDALAPIDPVAQPQGDDPDAPLTDLAGLRAIVGAARVVGLGQPGPGVRELTRLHHRFLRFLVEQAGFTGLALDVDASTAVALDRHVRGGAADLDATLLTLGDRTFATHELRAVLQWMRSHNQAHHADLRVFGLAPGDPETALTLVRVWLAQADPAHEPEATLQLRSGDLRAIDAVLARLDERRDALIAATSRDAWATARQQAELVAQYWRLAASWDYRAGEFMRARSVEWSLAQLGPNGKLMVWADNRRIAAEVPGNDPSMGDFLRQWLAADYRAIATSVGAGSHLVIRDAVNLCGAMLPPARAGSLDDALAGPLPFTLIDLRGLRGLRAPALGRPQRLRGFSGDGDIAELRVRPAIAFDAIVGVQHVHPATPLAAGPHARQYPEGPCYQHIGA
ncbi:erythromycin esterase family protein [Nannocystis sp.]|uniref:erythromycin esterase family protein n=1 Tax=Nannocystis sp. TaxID=1962667 RepID=UPI0025E66BE5|nr:erythromycin esterase family protein [Nannocystis sp.]MBK7828317.1 erythromycin esterase family protein [Nannocystis sp.]